MVNSVSRTNRTKVVVNQSNFVIRRFKDLADVDTTGKVTGSILIYNEVTDKFEASTLLNNQEVNGGRF